ncbi:MAG: drug/metabolite transporter (DMT)-like permease [Saprospiraceae bacterium]|jgi:drug/metabolite transporter (DMT)-like permease
MQEKQISARHFVILGVLSLVWGSSFILIKKALIAFHPFDLACMRLGVSAIAFTPVIIYHRKRIPWKRWKLFLTIGLTGSGIPAFMYFLAQTNINSMVSGLLNSLTPIWTLIIGIIIFKNQMDKFKTIGVAIGFIGAALLMIFGESEGSNANLWYGLFIVIGTLCYGMSGNLVKHYLQDVDSIIISATSFFLVGGPALILLVWHGTIFDVTFSEQEIYSFGALLLLSLIGTVLATVIFYKLIQETNAVFGSSVAYIMPLVAIFWGFLDGEGLGLVVLISMALILSGVYLIKKI